MIFRVGQKVVCVMGFRSRDPGVTYPVKGNIYTVRGYTDAPDQPDIPAIFLEEIVNPIIDWPSVGWRGEASFKALRFRPVVERKTDISIFTRMLTPAPRVKERTPCASS